MKNLTSFLADGPLDADKGATAVEYGLIVSLIAVVLITALLVLGPAVAKMFTDISSKL